MGQPDAVNPHDPKGRTDRQILEDVQKAIDGRNDMIWLAMQYQCKKCGYREWIGAGVGVEGPAEFREKDIGWIPSPMMGMRCIACGGETHHVLWREDAIFPPIDAPKGMRYFRFPRVISEEMIRNFGSILFCGEDAIGTADMPVPYWYKVDGGR